MNINIRNIIIDSDFDQNRILIIDFGSQYVQLIARRIREFGVYCEVWSYQEMVTEHNIRMFMPSGIILSGSSNSVNIGNVSDHYVLENIFCSGIPVLGICYGMHIMVVQLGGSVHRNLSKREFGFARLKIISDSLLFENIYDDCGVDKKYILNVWMSHQDTVVSIPSGFSVIGITDHANNISVIANEDKRLYGLQFHPEVTHTIQGTNILKRFVLNICSCKSSWRSLNIVNYLIHYIRKIVRKDSVVLAFSGGIDSIVTALLLQRAIGNDRLFCVFIDSGLLRYNEFSDIKKYIEDYSLNITYVLASNQFFNALIGVSDPEEKRRVIGKIFMEVLEEQQYKYFPHVKWLAQGTIYSDVIESGDYGSDSFKKSSVIKSHHNVGGLPRMKTMDLLEPIKNLFKDEVRVIGKLLGLSDNVVYRHPFPGPGLGIRILGEIKREYCELLRRADSIFIEELQRYHVYSNISQAFVIFLPIRSVGIMGDVRTYEWVVSLRAVESIDFMTARWAKLSYDLLGIVSNRIINEIHGISRVVYDISNKPPSTIEWE